MKALTTFVVAIAVLSVIHLIVGAAGLAPLKAEGLLDGFKKSNNVVLLNSFERESEAYLRTDEYIATKRIKANASHGKYSLQAKIYLKDYFHPTPTFTPSVGVEEIPLNDEEKKAEGAGPEINPVAEGEENKDPIKWQPTIYYAYDSPSAMRKTDWRGFDYFKMDVILGEDRPANAYLIAGDARGYRYQAQTVTLLSGRANALTLDIKDMKRNYLDISKIQFVGFVYDLAGRGSAPVVYMDNFRLEKSGD